MKRQDRHTPDADEYETLWPGWHQFWESRAGLGVATLLVVAIAGVMFFGNLSQLGIWEPWEANEILVAQEYQDREPPPPLEQRGPKAPSYNWAVPTKNQQPIARSLLKTWLISKTIVDGIDEEGGLQVGALEFSARLPLAVGAFLLVLLGFFWLRDVFDTWSALMVAAAVTSTPAIFMGVHTVSSEILFVATTSLAIFAFHRLVFTEGPLRFLWGILFGVGLALAFYDMRFVGLLVPLAVITAFGLTELPFHRATDVRLDGDAFISPLEIGLSILSFLAAGGVVAWGFWRSAGAQGDALLLPHVKQWMTLLIPCFLLLSGLFLAWQTRVVKNLRTPEGILGIGIAAAAIFPMLEAYADANPVLLKNGEILGDIPVLHYVLTNDLFGSTLPSGHPHFAMWIRELGFSLVPWVGFVPLGIGYLARSTRLCDDNGNIRANVLSEKESTKRLLLVWGFVGLVVVAAASVYNHYFYPAYFPLLAGVGLMLGDAEFWKRIRIKSLLGYFMGFAAIAITLMLAKDLERFPSRLIEVYMLFQEEVGLPEDYGYGELLDRLKYTWIVVSMTFFFGLASWAILTFRQAKEIPGRIWAWLLSWWKGESGNDEGQSPAHERAIAKEKLRHEDTLFGKVARFFEAPRTFGALITAVFVGSAFILLFDVAPSLGNHLSQRGIFETYTRVSDSNEKLYRLRVTTRDTSVYLRDVESISNTGTFLDWFDKKDRFFAVIPRDELSSLNREARRRYDTNIPVLDARSSQLLLVSNAIEEGEENQNFIADVIVEDKSEIQHMVTFEKNGKQVHPTFDNRLRLLGYSLDKKGDKPSYGWGEDAVLSTYFEVIKSVPTNQKIFMHVDYPGSRIHGDHYPNGGDFPTSDWLKGDIVKDVFKLHIDPYSSTGTYTMFFGLYRSGRRMKVKPRSAHDGENRIPMGKIKVTGF